MMENNLQNKLSKGWEEVFDKLRKLEEICYFLQSFCNKLQNLNPGIYNFETQLMTRADTPRPMTSHKMFSVFPKGSSVTYQMFAHLRGSSTSHCNAIISDILSNWGFNHNTATVTVG